MFLKRSGLSRRRAFRRRWRRPPRSFGGLHRDAADTRDWDSHGARGADRGCGRLFLRHSLVLTVGGIALGIGAAILLTRVMSVAVRRGSDGPSHLRCGVGGAGRSRGASDVSSCPSRLRHRPDCRLTFGHLRTIATVVWNDAFGCYADGGTRTARASSKAARLKQPLRPFVPRWPFRISSVVRAIRRLPTDSCQEESCTERGLVRRIGSRRLAFEPPLCRLSPLLA